MYILVRVIALCLFDAHACVQNQVCEFSGESQSSKTKYFHGFLSFTDVEYTCEMYVMHLGKEHIAQNSASLSGHTQTFSQSRFKLKDSSLLIHLIY